MTEHEEGPTGPERILAFDWLKAIAIVAVVLNHAKGYGPTDGLFGRFLGSGILSFHVPVFYVVSGYLYATADPRSMTAVGVRLRRILLPYLVASVAAIVLVRSRAGLPSAGMIVGWILTGGALGSRHPQGGGGALPGRLAAVARGLPERLASH